MKVHTRCQLQRDGVWKGWAVWPGRGLARGARYPYYTIRLKPDRHRSRLFACAAAGLLLLIAAMGMPWLKKHFTFGPSHSVAIAYTPPARTPVGPPPISPTPIPVRIEISIVPPAARGGPNDTYPISGTVKGLKPSEYSKYMVAIYAWDGAQWWVQPFDYDPLTGIGKDGSWQNDIHGGSKYAVLLVSGTESELKSKIPKKCGPQLPGREVGVVATERKP